MLKANVHAIIVSQANMAQEYSHHICHCEYSKIPQHRILDYPDCRIIRDSNQPTSASTRGRGTKLVPSTPRDLGSNLRFKLGIMEIGACQHWASSESIVLGRESRSCSRFLHTITNKPSLV